MANVEWKCRIHHQGSNIRTMSITGNEVKDHPLKIVFTERIPCGIMGFQSGPSVMLEPLTFAMEGIDPLTAIAYQELDPLSKMIAERRVSCEDKFLKETEVESWSSRRAAILSKYTTSEKISIVTSFLSEGEKVVVKAQSTAVDKIQYRLEQLDNFEEDSQRTMTLSQTEYINRIEQLNKELVSAWNSEQRVKALRIAIQCAKFLSDTNVLCFYPSKFVLITDILDIFGQLVYSRLRTKAHFVRPGSDIPTTLPEDFTPDMVPDSAKETCLNWFYKIASIRELVPRLYVEMSLMKCYSFLSLSEPSEAVIRLTRMINGIGNPLVAIYARCYLCRVGISIPNLIVDRSYLVNNLKEFLNSYNHLGSRSSKVDLSKGKMTFSSYTTLFTPALDFMFHVMACNDFKDLFNNLLDKCAIIGNSSLILNSIMAAFKPSLISTKALHFLEVIQHCNDEGIPLYILLRTLGLCVSVYPPPKEHRRQVLNTAWKLVSSVNNADEYISAAEAWVPYVSSNFSYREINALLGDIIRRLIPDRLYKSYYSQLKRIVDGILSEVQDTEVLLVMENFLPFVDLFQQESVHVDVCKTILTNCAKDHKISDPVVVNALMYLCSVLHESVNALLPDDESRQIGELLCHILKFVDYGKDFEQQLDFFVEARGLFFNLEAVLVQLIQSVNLLSINTRGIIKGSHTRKTGDFARACSSYCFITIPSIKSAKTRLNLYILSGQVALFNQCFGQADASFKAAFNVISELQKSYEFTEPQIVEYSKKVLSVLLVVPDNPDCRVLHLTRLLLNALQAYEWENRQSLVQIHLSVIDMLGVMAQEVYPYHIDKVESNDALYGSDQKFIDELDNMCGVIIGEILIYLKQTGMSFKQGQLVLELLMKIAIRSDLSPQMSTLSLNLWKLALKNQAMDRKYLVKVIEYLKIRGINNQNIQDLVEKMIL